MLKIVSVIEEGRFGGPQRWVSLVFGRLAGLGFNLVVIFPKFDSDRFYNNLSQKGIDIFRINLHRLTKDKKHLINFIIFFIPEIVTLYQFLKKDDIDIVHCNNSWQFKGVIAGKLARKKVVWHLHETSTPFIINIILKFLATYFVDAFIVAGNRVKNYYLSGRRLSVKPIIEIQSPVDTFKFDPKKANQDLKILENNGLKIITAGNINSAKGLEYFIEMAVILNKQYDNLSFFIVGPHIESQRVYSAKLFEKIRLYNLKNLHFYGESENMGEVLNAADIYVCSSITEASPLSVWEAMSMAKAIVSTDVGDVAKFIQDGESGYIVPIKSANALAEKVGLLIENKALRKKFGINAREIAIKKLDVEICVKKHVEFYREVINKL